MTTFGGVIFYAQIKSPSAIELIDSNDLHLQVACSELQPRLFLWFLGWMRAAHRLIGLDPIDCMLALSKRTSCTFEWPGDALALLQCRTLKAVTLGHGSTRLFLPNVLCDATNHSAAATRMALFLLLAPSFFSLR